MKSVFAKLLDIMLANCYNFERMISDGLLLTKPIHSLHNSSYVQKFLPTGFLRLFDVSLFAFFRVDISNALRGHGQIACAP